MTDTPDAPVRDYSLDWATVPMRDGVRLRTAVLRPLEADGPLPVLLYRSPYKIELDLSIPKLADLRGPGGREFAAGHIQVLQQVRGRGGSEGRLILRPPLRGLFNDGPVDEATDGHDTIDWIVTHLTGANGRVAMMGGSYSAWVALVATLDPHPALRAVIATAPEVDWWRGDDDFHNGAFRLGNSFEYAWGMETDPAAVFSHFPYDDDDLYKWWLARGSAVEVADHFQPGSYFHRLIAHPTYDAYWRGQALDQLLAATSARHVPTMLVHCLFDSYDPYGAPAVFAATRARDAARQDVFVAGPWDHGQNNRDAGDRLGPLVWEAPTAQAWRRDVARPFLDRHLGDSLAEAPAPGPADRPVQVFDTGRGAWASDGTFAAADHTVLWVAPHQGLDRTPPEDSGRHSYVSDPADPVPFRPRPIRPFYRSASGGFPAIGDPERGFGEWLLDDQRFAADRPDVLTLATAPLTQPLSLRGRATAVLRAVTSGEDCDWVVKLIDAYPEGPETVLPGYQLMVASEVFRARYRESLEHPARVPPGDACDYRFDLSYAAHTFQTGHRIVVQIQSSWFPLYDRNPQTFGPIMSARPEDFRLAVQEILYGPEGSRLVLPTLSVAG
jgi:putative CocE/NonD family hydrolase